MKTRQQKLYNLTKALTSYWGSRATAQLRYLEELLAHGQFSDESLSQKAIDFVWERYTQNGGVDKADVEDLERLLEPVRETAKAIRVSCVGHAHIDMNWMWAFDETVAVTVDTLRTMLALMEEYPSFTFMQSQASVYKIVEEFAPEMIPEIRRRIQTGQWEVTASTWVEADKNMTSGESLTRHLLYTKRYLQKLLELGDDDFQIDFEPDTFGHTAQVPEILKSGGVKYYYHCRGYDGHSLYRWEAPSGAQVTVFREPTWYNDNIAADTFLYIPRYCAENGLDRMCHVYGVGDHGGGATRCDIERLLDMAAWPCMPAIGFGRLRDFFAYIETLGLPVVRQELNVIFDGCFTSQSRIKKANRYAEASLGCAETLNALSQLCGGYRYSAEAFADAWENVLFSHFHDILPGSGVLATREYAMGMFQRTMAVANTRASAAARSIAGRVNTAALLPADGQPCVESRSEGGGVGYGSPSFRFAASAGVTGGTKRLFTIFNPVQADWNGPVELTVWDWAQEPARASIRDEKGEPLPFQLLDDHKQHYWAHEYFRLLVDVQIPAFGYTTVLLEEADAPVPYHYWLDARVQRAEPFVLENEKVRAEFDRASFRLRAFIDKQSGRRYIDSREGAGFSFVEEDVADGMSAWRVGRYMNVYPVMENVRLKNRVNGNLRSSLTFEAAIRHSKITATISLDSHADTLRYDVRCQWREIGRPDDCIPQLQFAVPLCEPVDSFTYDAAFATIRRSPMEVDVPAQSYAFAPGGRGGLLLMTDSKYGYRCTGDSMAVTLIRSSFDPDNLPEIYDHECSIGICLAADDSDAARHEHSLRFCRQPLAVAVMPQEGTLPPSGRLLSVRGGCVAVSCVKMDEDSGTDLIVRMAELAGQAGELAIRCLKEPRSVRYVDAHEQSLDKDGEIRDGEAVISIQPYQALAIRIGFEP